jgi:transposase-like protein
MEQKVQFGADYLRGTFDMSELCQRYDVNRKTGYKWVKRYIEHGPEALEERSRRPRTSPNRTASDIEAKIVEVRRRHPSWGGKKILDFLNPHLPDTQWPQRSTACTIVCKAYGSSVRRTS